MCPCRCPFCCLSLFIYVRFQFEKPENNFGWKTGTPGTRETSATKWGKRSQSQTALSTWAMPKKKEGKNTNETSKWYCGKKKEQKNRMEMSRQRWNILQQLLTEERTHTHTLTHRQTHSQQNLYLCEPRCGAISVTLGICIYAINIYAQIKTNCRKASWKSGISDGFV